MKTNNRSKRANLQRPAKVKFAMTGVVVCLFAGMLAGLVIELCLKRGMIVMQAGGFAGLVIGYLVETVRFWWRKRKISEGPKF